MTVLIFSIIFILFLYIKDFPGDSAGKEFVCNVGDLGSILGWEDPLEKGTGYPLQYSGLENSMDYSPWCLKESDTSEWLSLSIYFIIYLFGGSLVSWKVLLVHKGPKKRTFNLTPYICIFIFILCVCVCSRVLLKWKRTEKSSDIDIRRGTKSAPLLLLEKGVIYFFNWLLQ